jgi:predicted O-methyltransferase YrrM
MKQIIKKIAKKLPPIKRVLLERDQAREELKKYGGFVPPGHFYSPIPSLDEIKIREDIIFEKIARKIPSIDLNEEEQMNLFARFKKYYDELPFKADKTDSLRYFFENPAYSYSDAIFLYCMIRHAQPKAIIEIGSGYSSCVTLDTNELFFNNNISCTFIEPYPQVLEALIKEDDKDKIEIISRKLQDVEVDKFASLSSGDILFVDSTHVSKVDSDVNYIFFEILPSLTNGVYIHFHDIFYPFEYPKEWIYEGRAWNENYILRAFLQYNRAFKVIFCNTFLEHFYEEKFMSEMPLCMKNKGGSIWLKKI